MSGPTLNDIYSKLLPYLNENISKDELEKFCRNKIISYYNSAELLKNYTTSYKHHYFNDLNNQDENYKRKVLNNAVWNAIHPGVPPELQDESTIHEEAHGLARSPQTPPVSIVADTSQFFLDFCLPPDRAEETRVALEDVCEKRWLPRYGHRRATIICRVHVARTVIAHHASWITKFGGLILGMAGLKELSRRLWGS